MAVSLDQQPQPSAASMYEVSEADCLQAFRKLSQRQARMSQAKLNELHDRLLGPKGVFVRLGRELERLGRQAPLLKDMETLCGPARRTLADKVLSYALGYHNRRSASWNPFRAASRERLCWMIYDKNAPFILVERYVALLALHQRDGMFFSRLIETTRGSVERRIMFCGLLEHHDALLPVERSVYPPSYRIAQQSHLDHEEAIYGPLNLGEPVLALLEARGPKRLLKYVMTQLEPGTMH